MGHIRWIYGQHVLCMRWGDFFYFLENRERSIARSAKPLGLTAAAQIRANGEGSNKPATPEGRFLPVVRKIPQTWSQERFTALSLPSDVNG